MTWLDPTLIKAGYEIYKEFSDSKQTKKRLSRFANWIIEGETQVAVLGAGGTGKTTFEHLITAEDPMFAPTTYRSDWTTQKVVLPGEVSARLLVAPGQERYIATEWKAIFSRLSKFRSVAIVNVVGFGHHAFKFDSIRETEAFKEGQSLEEWRAHHCDYWRKREIEMLEVVADGLREISTSVWFLTIVAKQDLWWPQKPAVVSHYTDPDTSAYAWVIAKLESDFAARGLGFSHHALGVSQVHENFVTKDEGVVFPVAEGYSLSEHLNSLYNAVGRVNELLEAGAPPARQP